VTDLVLTLVLTAVFATAFWTALEWSFRAGLFPRMVTGLGLGLSVLQLVVLLTGARRRPPTVQPPAAPQPAELPEPTEADDEANLEVEYVFAHAGGRAWARSLAWIAAFFVSLYVLGLLITAPLFSLAFLRFSARVSWWASVLYAVVIGGVLYLAFEVALRLPVPPGLFL
jgi:hypothetical protein